MSLKPTHIIDVSPSLSHPHAASRVRIWESKEIRSITLAYSASCNRFRTPCSSGGIRSRPADAGRSPRGVSRGVQPPRPFFLGPDSNPILTASAGSGPGPGPAQVENRHGGLRSTSILRRWRCILEERESGSEEFWCNKAAGVGDALIQKPSHPCKTTTRITSSPGIRGKVQRSVQ